jgi:hypothetical protein
MNIVIAAGVLFAVLVILARFISVKGLSVLTTEEKGRYLEVAASIQKISLLILAFLILVFVFLGYQQFISPLWLTGLYLGSFLVYNMVSSFVIYRKMQAAGLPAVFSGKWFLSTALRMLGLLILMAGMLYAFSLGLW